MSIIDEVELIGPGHRRKGDSIHYGYWTPELASWSDRDSFTSIRDLQYFAFDDTGLKVTGAGVNASPILCIVKDPIGENDLTVSFTGSEGILDSNQSIITGNITLTGFSSDHQYGINIYRREWVTGGDTIMHEFTIPKYTNVGTIFQIPSKRIYKVDSVTVTPQNSTQPVTSLGFYALADNGSKLLYSLNWNTIFDNIQKCLYGMYGHPKKCVRCNGSGYVTTETDTCMECAGYGFDGPNASGYLVDMIAKDAGVIQGDNDDKKFRNKIWALKEWWVTPTKKEISRYFAHFARITTASIEIYENDRTVGATGVERVVDLMLPYNIPDAIFGVADPVWSQMAEKVEPAGIQIRFSFLSQAFTGDYVMESLSSVYMNYISGGIEYTGYTDGIDDTSMLKMSTYGFYEPFAPHDFGSTAWYDSWGQDWFGFNYLTSGHISGSISGLSGLMKTGATSPIWVEGLFQGDIWLRMAWPANSLVNDTVWETGGSSEIDQDAWYTGTFLLDNFWCSGLDGIQY